MVLGELTNKVLKKLGELTIFGRVGNWASRFLGELTKIGRVGFWASWELGDLTRTLIRELSQELNFNRLILITSELNSQKRF